MTTARQIGGWVLVEPTAAGEMSIRAWSVGGWVLAGTTAAGADNRQGFSDGRAHPGGPSRRAREDQPNRGHDASQTTKNVRLRGSSRAVTVPRNGKCTAGWQRPARPTGPGRNQNRNASGWRRPNPTGDPDGSVQLTEAGPSESGQTDCPGPGRAAQPRELAAAQCRATRCRADKSPSGQEPERTRAKKGLRGVVAHEPHPLGDPSGVGYR